MSSEHQPNNLTASHPTCGAKTRDGSACANWPAHGRNRCRFHGGGSYSGIAHPNYIHGMRSTDPLVQSLIQRPAFATEQEWKTREFINKLRVEGKSWEEVTIAVRRRKAQMIARMQRAKERRAQQADQAQKGANP